MMRNPGVYKYTVEGDSYRVVIADDVVAVPTVGWSSEGYGSSISVEWLLAYGKLPGNKRTKLRLAAVIRQAMADHHGYELNR